MKRRIAGHEWLDDKIDSPCINNNSDGSPCRMTRAILFGVTEADIDKVGWAHQGNMNRSEYNEIIGEKTDYEAHCQKLMDALRSVCG